MAEGYNASVHMCIGKYERRYFSIESEFAPEYKSDNEGESP